MRTKHLVVAVHPDDETLGCGGLLLKHRVAGHEIFWMIITNVSEAYGWDKDRVDSRQKEIEKVSKLYSFNDVFKLDFPTTKLGEIPFGDIASAISNVFNTIKPSIVYLPNRGDVHTDHRIAFDAAYSCTKSFRYPFVKKILMMETLSETEFAPSLLNYSFIPNVFFDISSFIDKKIEIFNTYESEIMKPNQPRNERIIRSLAAYRGSRIGAEYAEAFQLLLSIE